MKHPWKVLGWTASFILLVLLTLQPAPAYQAAQPQTPPAGANQADNSNGDNALPSTASYAPAIATFGIITVLSAMGMRRLRLR